MKEQLFTDLYDRDEALREQSFFLGFPEKSTASAYSTFALVLTRSIYIPRHALGITLAAQFKKVGGAGCFFEWFLDGTSVAAEDFTTSDSTYDDSHRKTLAAISPALRGTRVDITLKLAALGGGTAFAIQTDGPACRFE